MDEQQEIRKKERETKRELQRKITEQKNEFRNLINKYPKLALQGTPLELDAEWKKPYITLISLAIINIDMSKKMLLLANQISDSTNEHMQKGENIDLTDETKKEIQAILRIKNILISTSNSLEKHILPLTNIIIAHKNEIEETIFLYIIGEKESLTQILVEQRTTADSINSTLAECFHKAIVEGALNLEALEKETLMGIDTQGDIERTIKMVYESTDLNKVIK